MKYAEHTGCEYFEWNVKYLKYPQVVSVKLCTSWIRRILVLFVVDAAGKPCCHAFGGWPSGTATDCYIDASTANVSQHIQTAKHSKKNRPESNTIQ